MAAKPTNYMPNLRGEMAQEKNNFTQTCVLVCSLILIVIAFALSAAGLFSPSWQVVDIREFRAEHHVCGIRKNLTSVHLTPFFCSTVYGWTALVPSDTWLQLGRITVMGNRYIAHTSSITLLVIGENMEDIDQNSAAGESEHHQFFAWHKAVLGCLIVSLLFASLALCCGLCAPCNGGCAVIFSIFVFLSCKIYFKVLQKVFMAVIGDGIFFFAAHRVDNRFVQGLVGTYEQQIGVAFYLHGSGTLVLMFGFLVAVIASYQILRKSELSNSLPLRELAPLYGSRMRETFA
ncbi:Clc-like protein [Ostertagia ostertagi]